MQHRAWLVVLWSAWACASEPSEADRLFRAARGLVAQKNYLEACPLFEHSQRLEPALGTLLNLADCFEQTHRLPEAYWAFSAVQSQAKAKNDARREDAARVRAEALRARLVLVRIEQAEAGSTVEVLRSGDEKVIFTAQVSTVPIALEVGEYRVRVRSTGRPQFEQRLSLQAAGSTSSVVVTAPAPVAVPEPVAELLPPPPPPLVSQATVSEPGLRPLAVVGLVVGGALMVSGGIGIGYSQDVVTRVARQQPGGPDVNAPTVTRKVYETAQVLYPMSVAGAALGVTSVVLGIVFAKAPRASAGLVPSGTGGFVAQVGVTW